MPQTSPIQVTATPLPRSRKKADPRLSIKYKRAIEMIDLLNAQGPMPIEELMTQMGIDHSQFKEARYSYPGRLAMADRGVVIPRPVLTEGYIYKLAETYQSGVVDTDGEPNLQRALGDMAHRQAVIFSDIDNLVDRLPAGSSTLRWVKKLRSSMLHVLERVDDMSDPSKVGDAAIEVDELVDHILRDAGIR